MPVVTEQAPKHITGDVCGWAPAATVVIHVTQTALYVYVPQSFDKLWHLSKTYLGANPSAYIFALE